MSDVARKCPYCQSRLSKWRVPDEATWNEEFLYVCFDDECSYYKTGWTWMQEKYNQHASYRYAYSAEKDASMMIPVWSDSATRELILDDDEGDDK